MSYTKHTWVNGEILDADKMNHLEDGVVAVSANGAIGTANLADNAVTSAKIADGAVTAAKLGADVSAVLDNKANIDGSYESMTVGNAEQLVSSVGIEEQTPYNFRTSGGSTEIGDREELNAVVGGTVAWNQHVQTNSASVTVPNAHKYLSRINGTNTIAISNGSAISINNGTKDNVFDLTAMFGSAIADYVYTLESGTAGAGIAWLKKYGYFTKPYYPYKAASIESVKTSAHRMVGFNQFDKSKAVNGKRFNTTGITNVASGFSRTDWIRVIPNTMYYFKDMVGRSDMYAVYWYDADKNYITSNGISGASPKSGYFTAPANAYYVGVNFRAVDIDSVCVSLRLDGERDGEYEPYEAHEYALDDVELRGIPKLDASNNLCYDGDRYLPDGTVERRYAEIDLGTLNWTAQSLSNNRVAYVTSYASWDNAPWLDKPALTIPTPAVCVAFDHMVAQSASSWGSNVGVFTDTAATLPAKSFAIIKDSGTYADAAAFKAAMNNVKLVYKIATPTTEAADTYQQTQIVDDFGTEEFVDAAVEAGERDVAIPVGNETVYKPNLRAKLEMAPDSPDGDGDYIVRQTNGTNSYIPLVEVKELPDMPSEDGSYKLRCTVSNGTATLSWISDS